MNAARAAVENAKAQLAMRQEALAAVKQSADLSAVGGMEKRLGVDIDPAQKRLETAQKQLDDATQRLQEIQTKIDTASSAATNAVTAPVKATSAAVDDATRKVEQLGKTITVSGRDNGC